MSGPARFTLQAASEIVDALRSLGHDAARAAMREPVETSSRRLGVNPRLGRSAPAALSLSCRFWSSTRFGDELVYDPATQPVKILRCVHVRRDLPRALADLHDLPDPPADPGDGP